MKHIGFDDSTVLREFAKIASERKLLVKTANQDERIDIPEPDTKPEGGQVPDADLGPKEDREPEIPEANVEDGNKVQALIAAVESAAPSGPAKVVYDGLVNELKQGKGSDPMELGKHLMSRYTDPALQSLIKQHLGPAAAPLVQLVEAVKAAKPSGGVEALPYDMLLKELSGYSADASAKDLLDILAKRYAQNPELLALIQRTLVNTAKSANRADDNVKVAAGDKVYDVTGETGEQLVDSAHPGGGTKTELTHSKTDENHVETIVEQQKKDLEVAHSVPKGVYAALTQLANTLDSKGHIEAADKVDALLKKYAALTLEQMKAERAKSMNMATDQFIDNVLRGLDQKKSELPAATWEEIRPQVDRARNYIAGLKGRPITQAQQMTMAAMSQLQNVFTPIGGTQVMFSEVVPDAVDANVNRYLTMAGQYGQMINQQGQQGASNEMDFAGTSPLGEKDLQDLQQQVDSETGMANTEKDKKKKSNPKIKQLQALIGMGPRAQDGIWGPRTNAAFRAYIKEHPELGIERRDNMDAVLTKLQQKGQATTRPEAAKQPEAPKTPAEKAAVQDQGRERLREIAFDYFKDYGTPPAPAMQQIQQLLNSASKFWDLSNEGAFNKAKTIMLNELKKRWKL